MLIAWRYRLLVHIPWVVSCLLLVGCVADRKTTLEQQQASAAGWTGVADLTTSVRPEPLPGIEFTDKAGNSLKIPQQAATDTKAKIKGTENTTASASGAWGSIVSLPLGMQIILVAAGVAALLAVWWIIRRSSKAVDAAWTWADEALTDQIHKVRDQMADATDPAKIASLRSIEASLLRKQAEALRP